LSGGQGWRYLRADTTLLPRQLTLLALADEVIE
jgi:hypothetical protein